MARRTLSGSVAPNEVYDLASRVACRRMGKSYEPTSGRAAAGVDGTVT